MMVFDPLQQQMLDDVENEILAFAASIPEPEGMDDRKKELEHFGFTLGSA